MEPAVERASSRLVVRGLRARYETDVFRGVDLDVAPGEVLGITGPNGCGKTTLLRSLARLHHERDGEVTLPGAGRVALVSQSHRETFFPWANLRTNLVLTSPGGLSRYRTNAQRVDRVACDLGLDLDLRLSPGQASDGMLQQAAVIRAFVCQPDLLLADEPFSALDVEVARRIRRYFRATVMAHRIVALVVLHDLESLVEVCDRVLVIDAKPYSTSDEEGTVKAPILTNRWARRPEDDPGGRALSRIVGRVLGGDGG